MAKATGVEVAPASERLPTPLGKQRLARIDAAYRNLRPALAQWKVESFGEDCLIVFGSEDEWLLGCPAMAGSAGFVPTGEKRGGHDVLWNPRSFSLSESYQPYDSVKMGLVGTVTKYHVDKTGVDRPVLIVQEWDALHQNHPGFQQSSLEEWLGIFVHEAFHAHQLWHPRVQSLTAGWAKAATPPASADELANFYKSNTDYKAAVTHEYEVLRAAVVDPKLDAKSATAALAAWLALYRERGQRFGGALEAALPGKQAWTMDGFSTFLEGTARYVEASFLTNPSTESAVILAGEPTFKEFRESRGKPIPELSGLGGIGNKYFYAVGLYLSLLLDHADPEWKSKLFDDDRLLIAAVERVATKKP